jgi:hypothetical protein
MGDEGGRSRSPRGAQPVTEDRMKQILQEAISPIATGMQTVAEQLELHEWRLNTLTQKTAYTEDQVQYAQQLEASRQALVSGWADEGPQDRERALKAWIRNAGLVAHVVTYTTLRQSPFTIIEFTHKEYRNRFMEEYRRNPLRIQGRQTYVRPQVPKYQREADQPFRCAIATLSSIDGYKRRYKPTWELAAVWSEDEWVLAKTAHHSDATKIFIYVPGAIAEEFETKFKEEWAAWGRRQTSYKPQNYYTITVKTLEADMKRTLDTEYEAKEEARQDRIAERMSKQTPQGPGKKNTQIAKKADPRDDDAMLDDRWADAAPSRSWSSAPSSQRPSEPKGQGKGKGGKKQ